MTEQNQGNTNRSRQSGESTSAPTDRQPVPSNQTQPVPRPDVPLFRPGEGPDQGPGPGAPGAPVPQQVTEQYQTYDPNHADFVLRRQRELENAVASGDLPAESLQGLPTVNDAMSRSALVGFLAGGALCALIVYAATRREQAAAPAPAE